MRLIPRLGSMRSATLSTRVRHLAAGFYRSLGKKDIPSGLALHVRSAAQQEAAGRGRACPIGFNINMLFIGERRGVQDGSLLIMQEQLREVGVQINMRLRG